MEEKTSPEIGPEGCTVKQWEDMIRRSYQTPMVKSLKEHIEKARCKVGDNFIKAVHCDTHMAGSFTPGGIIVCSNYMWNQNEVNLTVMHELIHAYDDCRDANLDWDYYAHRACSEIRAYHLSGECHYTRELLWGLMKIKDHDQDCVRRLVMESTAADPSAAKDAMEAVWDICYNDTKPFDRAP